MGWRSSIEIQHMAHELRSCGHAGWLLQYATVHHPPLPIGIIVVMALFNIHLGYSTASTHVCVSKRLAPQCTLFTESIYCGFAAAKWTQ
eukprot:gene17699-5553_t